MDRFIWWYGVHCARCAIQDKVNWSTNVSYLEIGLKLAVVDCLTNGIAPPPIALESCSGAQTDWPVF